jgi:hypothetical protein
VFDNDFRDKNDTYVPPEGGTTADLAMTLPEQDRIQLAKTIDDLCSGRKEEACLQYHVMLPHSKKKFYWSESYAIVAERDADGARREALAQRKELVAVGGRAELAVALRHDAAVAQDDEPVRPPQGEEAVDEVREPGGRDALGFGRGGTAHTCDAPPRMCAADPLEITFVGVRRP